MICVVKSSSDISSIGGMGMYWASCWPSYSDTFNTVLHFLNYLLPNCCPPPPTCRHFLRVRNWILPRERWRSCWKNWRYMIGEDKSSDSYRCTPFFIFCVFQFESHDTVAAAVGKREYGLFPPSQKTKNKVSSERRHKRGRLIHMRIRARWGCSRRSPINKEEDWVL